jgi:glutamine amidotransferase
MCRHLAYVGPPVNLHSLVFGAPRSLCEQSRHPRHQVSGDTNPDGWGVAWYEPATATPQRYRTVTPIWDDDEFRARSRTIESGGVLTAARLASPGSTLVATGNAPFVSGPWSCSLNGVVRGFHDGVGDRLRAALSPARAGAIEGDTDTEVLFGLVLDRLDAGDDPAAALVAVVGQVLALTTGRLNLLLCDGRRAYATRVGNSLFTLGGVIASEPLDDGPWREVEDSSVVAIDAGRAVSTPFVAGRA